MRQIKVKSIFQQVEITGDEAKHLIYSLRSKSGEKITVVDPSGQRALVELIDFTKDKVIAQLIEILPPRQQENITLAVAIPKRGLDDIIRQATEIGVSSIQPLITTRTIAKPSSAKQERWQRIAKEAAEQSGAIEPTIKPLTTLNEYVKQLSGQVIICNETEDRRKISEITLSDEITIIIGCEGGFSENEIKLLEDIGVISVTLGYNILRVDTAAIVALAIIKNYLNPPTTPVGEI